MQGKVLDMKSCFLIGHRRVPEDIQERLEEVVEQHILQCGVTCFTVGHYGAFDGMAAQAVKEAKKKYPEVRLYLLLPYHPHDQPIPTPKGYDGTYYPPGMETIPKRAAIVQANRRLVNESDYLIAYLKHCGNTRDLVEYAQRREKRGLIQITLL